MRVILVVSCCPVCPLVVSLPSPCSSSLGRGAAAIVYAGTGRWEQLGRGSSPFVSPSITLVLGDGSSWVGVIPVRVAVIYQEVGAAPFAFAVLVPGRGRE